MNLVIEYLKCVSYREDRFAEEAYRGKRLPKFYLIIWFGTIINTCFKIMYCSLFGHKWTDDGYATPEFGFIDINCERCGFSHGIEYLY
jgi:hypothetical protein